MNDNSECGIKCLYLMFVSNLLIGKMCMMQSVRWGEMTIIKLHWDSRV